MIWRRKAGELGLHCYLLHLWGREQLIMGIGSAVSRPPAFEEGSLVSPPSRRDGGTLSTPSPCFDFPVAFAHRLCCCLAAQKVVKLLSFGQTPSHHGESFKRLPL